MSEEGIKRTIVNTCAREAVGRIVKDLADRSGLDGAWYGIDDDIRVEILDVWTQIVRDAIKKARCRTQTLECRESRGSVTVHVWIVIAQGHRPYVSTTEPSPERYLKLKSQGHRVFRAEVEIPNYKVDDGTAAVTEVKEA